MNQNLDKKWFIAQIKPNSYHTAIQNLERQGFETFLPKMEITQRQENKFFLRTFMFSLDIYLCVLTHTSFLGLK